MELVLTDDLRQFFMMQRKAAHVEKPVEVKLELERKVEL